MVAVKCFFATLYRHQLTIEIYVEASAAFALMEIIIFLYFAQFRGKDFQTGSMQLRVENIPVERFSSFLILEHF